MQRSSVAVADVERAPIGLDPTRSHGVPVLLLLLLLSEDVLHDLLHQRGGSASGHELTVVVALHCFVFHVSNIRGRGVVLWVTGRTCNNRS